MADVKGDELLTEAQSFEPLGRCSVLSYGVGHMLNDVTSACWFTYLLLFLTEVGLSAREAATVMLSGQVADGLMTVFAGELIDSFGRFKLWHFGGSILVAVSFSSVFGGCMLCSILGTNSAELQTIGYSIFAAIFNIGWAATQVSHMSMVNCMTLNPTSRVSLASCRNAFTMVANLSLFAIALIVFSVYDGKVCSDVIIQYRWIAYVSIFIGCCFLVVFYIKTKEPELKQRSDGKCQNRVSWIHWFRKVLYFQVAIVYMLTRLVTNVSQALLAFYVTKDLGMNQFSKALIPGIIYTCSFLASISLQEIRWTCFRLKALFTVGAILWIFSGVALFGLPSKMHDLMYVLSVIVGAANALMTVTTIGMQSILVGEDLNGSAFVYGSLSFLDKISCGIALYVLESYEDSTDCQGTRGYHSVSRYGTGLLPSCFALISLLVTSTMKLQEAKSTSTLKDALLA
ncbi:uncharacterized protein [Typha angustifolia]|uniref:uncharacterized protein n=1 Tax=Typha angustifolia TaxID=59011 RepID=UPI003C2F2A9C